MSYIKKHNLHEDLLNHINGMINSEDGFRGVRVWDKKLEEYDEVNAQWTEVLTDVELKDATLTEKGIIQLTNTVDEVETLAVTPKGVKDYVETVLDEMESSLQTQQVRIKVGAGATSIPINITSYHPDTHILFLFDNTTKVFRDEYEIVESTSSDSGYEISLLKTLNNIENRNFEIVTIYGKALVNGQEDMYSYTGSTPPTDTSMIWTKI